MGRIEVTRFREGVEYRVLDVPKIMQKEDYCGPASLAMVLRYWGTRISQDGVARLIGGKEEILGQGVNGGQLVRAARELGYIAHIFTKMRIEDVIAKIDKDIPLIAYGRQRWERDYHVYVIRGYDKKHRIFFINDPTDLSTEAIDWNRFKTFWTIKEDGVKTHYTVSVRPREE